MYKLMNDHSVVSDTCCVKVTKFLDFERSGITECPD